MKDIEHLNMYIDWSALTKKRTDNPARAVDKSTLCL